MGGEAASTDEDTAVAAIVRRWLSVDRARHRKANVARLQVVDVDGAMRDLMREPTGRTAGQLALDAEVGSILVVAMLAKSAH